MQSELTILLTDSAVRAAVYHRTERRWERADLLRREATCPVLPRTADDVAALVGELGDWLLGEFPGGVTCRMIVPTSWSLTHIVADVPDRAADQVARFAYEKFVPVSLEDLTCETGRVGRGERLVVGVFTESMLSLLEGLERRLIVIESLVLDGLLLASLPSAGGVTNASGLILMDDRRLVLLVPATAPGEIDLIRSTLLPDGEAGAHAARHFQATVASMPRRPGHWRLLAIGDSAAADVLAGSITATDADVDLLRGDESIDAMLPLQRAAPLPVDLRRDALTYAGRWRPLRARLHKCGVAAAVFFAVLAVRMRVEITSYACGLEELIPLANAAYRHVFPDVTPPPGAAMRLRSERIKLAALTEASQSSEAALQGGGLVSLRLLEQVISRIPKEVKLDVTEIVVDDRSVRVSGRTTSHGAAGELVQMLGGVPSLAVDPPRTKLRKDHTVDFWVHAERGGHGR